MNLILKPFYFIRHGETSWNKRRVYMGAHDIPLNETGENQAREASGRFKNLQITHIVTSPLQRAQRTAELLNESLKAKIIIMEEFSECAWGEYEGKPLDEEGILVRRWLEGNPPPGAERFDLFYQRIRAGLLKIQFLPEYFLIVAHRGVYYAIQSILGFPIIVLENCESVLHTPPENPQERWSRYSL